LNKSLPIDSTEKIFIDQDSKKEFIKEIFFKDLTFYVDVVNKKINERKNYKDLIEAYGGEVF